MKKKALGVFIAVLTLAVLSTTMIGSAQACQWRKQASRIKEPYYAEYGVMPVSPPTVDKMVGVCRIRSGSVLQGAYDGPVGVGTMTAELIIQVENTKNEKSVTIFKNTLEITSGPYGAFTLKGLTHFKYDEDGFVSGKTVLQGISELGPVTIIADKGFKPPPKPIWEEGIIIHP